MPSPTRRAASAKRTGAAAYPAGLEEKIDALEGQIAANAKDFVKLNELMAEKEQAESQLEERVERWMYLQEKYEEIMAAKE